jgi:putative tricarboxylic transport membrane protein
MNLFSFINEFIRLAMDPMAIVYLFLATAFGIIAGMLPGLTATMGVALLTGLTFRFVPDQAVIMLVGAYVGAIYGGSRSAILLNIPGTPGNAGKRRDLFGW